MSTSIAVIQPDAVSSSIEAAEPTTQTSSAWSDWVGMLASIGCAIHCAAMPFVIAYLPALGLSFLADEAFHQWMAVGCFFIALTAFVPGLRRHGSWMPTAIGTVGLVMISVAAFGFAGECCPSCEASDSAALHTDEVVCTDTECTLCETMGTSEPTTGSQSEMSWLSQAAPWMTPLGGLALVSAHLLNRRYGCLCSTCGIHCTEERD